MVPLMVENQCKTNYHSKQIFMSVNYISEYWQNSQKQRLRELRNSKYLQENPCFPKSFNMDQLQNYLKNRRGIYRL